MGGSLWYRQARLYPVADELAHDFIHRRFAAFVWRVNRSRRESDRPVRRRSAGARRRLDYGAVFLPGRAARGCLTTAKIRSLLAIPSALCRTFLIAIFLNVTYSGHCC